MTPEEIEELRALVTRLGANAYDENLAAILGAALEHIDQQDAQLAEYRKPMESMDTEQLTDWNVKFTELLYAPDSEREYPPWQIAVGDHLEKFAKSWNSSRIAELESQILHQTAISACRIEERERLRAQVAALQEIAVEERAYILSLNVLESRGVDEFHRVEARRRLAEEHPEIFGD
jgi:hypothetical protein